MSDRPPDALKLPAGYGGPGTPEDRLRRDSLQMRGIFGGRPIYFRNQVAYTFASPSMGDSLLFPHDHPRSGEERYTWVEREDGVQYGYLKPDAEGTEGGSHAG